MRVDLYTLANRLKVQQLELIAYAIGIQTKIDKAKSEDAWEQILFFFSENEMNNKNTEQLNKLYKEISIKEANLLRKKESEEADFTNEIRDLEHHLDQIIDIINKTKSETKL